MSASPTQTVPAGFIARKTVELRQKLASLDGEFAQWRAQSTTPAGHRQRLPLEKHRTQILRATELLAGSAERIGSQFPNEGEPLLEQCRELEFQILEVHRVWDFFRSKLVQRKVEWYGDYLAAADDFAWACYEPAQRSIPEGAPQEERFKTPPLVFFNGGTSPFIMTRRDAYRAEEVPGERLQTAATLAMLRSLPVPVIGIPWFQVRYLPDALIIAHEVGHCVEDDFALTPSITRHLDEAMAAANVPDARRPAWRTWAGEIFADLYGALATGVAFLSSLVDFLATGGQEIAGEAVAAPRWGTYPTAHLRVRLVLDALGRAGPADAISMVAARWQEAHPAHAMEDFVPDVPCVVAALIDRSFENLGGKRLTEVIAFPEESHRRALADAGRMLERHGSEGRDARELFATARLAFEQSPDGYVQRDVGGRLLRRIAAVRASGPRSSRRHQGAETLERIIALDRQTGRDLITTLRSPKPSPGS